MERHRARERAVRVRQRRTVHRQARARKGQPGGRVHLGGRNAADDVEPCGPVVRGARAQLDVDVEPVAQVGDRVGVGRRRGRSPREHRADAADHGAVAAAPQRPEVNGERCRVAQPPVRELPVVVGRDGCRAEVGKPAVGAEVRPVGDVLCAACGAGAAGVPVAALDPERADQLVSVVVQADALQLLVAGVTAGLAELGEECRTDPAWPPPLQAPGRRRPSGWLARKRRPPGAAARIGAAGRPRPVPGGTWWPARPTAPAPAEPGRGLATGPRRARAAAAAYQVLGQLSQDVEDDERPRADLDMAFVNVAPDRLLVGTARIRHDLPGQHRAHQRQHREGAPVPPRGIGDPADVGQRRPRRPVAALPGRQVVHADAGNPRVVPARTLVVADVEAHVLIGARGAQPAGVPAGLAELHGGLQPVLLRAEGHTGEALVGGVELFSVTAWNPRPGKVPKWFGLAASRVRTFVRP